MKTMFKPLALAAAVAATTAGYTGVSQAQVANNGLGDLAIVPYYTAEEGFVTGLHIINTSDMTQVVKLRLRRGSDSMDALDFNLIMSPYDEWTGFIDDEDGRIVVTTDDTTCTAPAAEAGGRFPMPIGSTSSYEEGAEEGYIEVIGMGSAASSMPISIAATHTAAGVPLNCSLVRSNFFRNATAAGNGDTSKRGILSSATSNQTCNDTILTILNGGVPTTCAATATLVQLNTYGDTDNVLKVSFFHRDADTGLEFGNDAVHLADFNSRPMMSNQEKLIQGTVDFYGYLYPDLDGGSPADTPRGRYDAFVRPALGAEAIINDWSVASARNVSTDWVVTMPGQYTMLDQVKYTNSLSNPAVLCLSARAASLVPPPAVETVCDARDIPVDLSIAFWDREEQSPADPEGDLVISPSTTVTAQDSLPYEVNVIQWNDGTNPPVLPSQYAKSYNIGSTGYENGWAMLSVSSSAAKAPQAVFDWAASYATVPYTPTWDAVTYLSVPIVGYVAWERSFPQDPSANYGRIIEHSFISGSSAP